MRKLKYYVACSVDGFIAREDGSFDFALPEGEHLADLFESFPETVPAHLREVLGLAKLERAEHRWFDAVLMGRRTYEVGVKLGVTDPYPTLDQYLFSRSMTKSLDANVELVSENAVERVRELKSGVGKDIWLCGGGSLAAVLATEIDEVIVKSNPVLLGSGIPMFAGAIEQIDLELIDRKAYDNGFMLLRYRVRG